MKKRFSCALAFLICLPYVAAETPSLYCRSPQRQTVPCLCAEVAFCAGDPCGPPSDIGLDDAFDVVLQDNSGAPLESKRLAYQHTNFCFDGRPNGKYKIVFITYKQGVAQAPRVHPVTYRQNKKKYCGYLYDIYPPCPKKAK